MEEPQIRFDDGAAYEDFMGAWSRLAGAAFLDWLAPPPGLRWLDVGCGNGAFTEMLADRALAADVEGIDPSPEQVAFARQRLAGRAARVQLGDAMDLPCPDASVDAAVMALVIFFVPDPEVGVAEMARVVRPGGSVSAYAWDILGGGFPYAALQQAMQAQGIAPLWPPRVEAARLDALRDAWAAAGLVDVRTHEIVVERRFASFDAFWQTARKGPRMAPRIDEISDAGRDELRARVRASLVVDADGGITCRGVANAVRGRKPD